MPENFNDDKLTPFRKWSGAFKQQPSGYQDIWRHITSQGYNELKRRDMKQL